MTKRNLVRFAKALFGLLLLGIVVMQINLAELKPLLASGDPWLLVGSVLSFVISLCVFQALRLHVLLAYYTGSLAATMRLFFVGAFFNNLLPSNVGGDAIRLLYLSKMKGGGWAGPMSLLLLHRVSGLLVMVLTFLVYAAVEGSRFSALATSAGLTVQQPTPWLVPVSLTMIVATIVALYAARRTRLGRRVYERASAALTQARAALGQLTTASLTSLTVLTILFHVARMFGFYFAVRYLGQYIALWDLVPVLTFTAIMALLPITVGGLGLVEGSVGVGLQMFGVSPSAAIAAALINRAVMVLTALIGGFMYAAEQSKKESEAKAPSPSA